MDLSYFLEMVDVKHRYGSNLRKYHAEWQSRPTNENFFYWLDRGEGRDVEVEKCSRERLERMQVRYLGREERRLYEVVVDKEGKLCWRKDGVRVDTTDQWRDSIRGIVRVGDPTPQWAPNRPAVLRGSSESSGMSSEEENVTSPTNSPPASPVEARQEAGSITGVMEEPGASKSSTTRMSFGDMFRKPAEARNERKKEEKKKKQIWIFVCHEACIDTVWWQLIIVPGRRYEQQLIYRHKAIRRFPAFVVSTWCKSLCCWTYYDQEWPIAK